jgi:drug/metabolite transporter (DMT)-like permease
MNPSTKANCYLFFISALWGATFPLVHNAVAHINPNLFVGARFLLGALLLIPLVKFSLKATNKQLLLHSILLGTISSGAYLTQTIGLQTIASGRAAFITGSSVVLVPLLTPLFKLGKLSLLDILYSIICLAGLYILTGTNLHGLSTGDLWVLTCAILFAISISYLQYVAIKFKNHQALAFYMILFTAPLPLAFSFGTDFKTLFNSSTLIGLLFCAIAATSVALYLQTKYQPYTTAAKAALIYSLEPVFACVFAFFINHEDITPAMVIGGSIILLSLMLPALLQLWRR